ncbi:MAG TPA: hypothetical protein PK669_08700 [Methanosarcina thermophila]|uniref:hypothetical protein n=1 Tax=Methanosarcina thermophila TaxID=2210 RepID=UPI0012E037F7|nr:hypothetical protein [Methanosarcina thermophila]NLU57309.1 hypothetical protein [Methanosarcina thermophila]HOA69194.1 hypothetical protein [Methanosarcina thermophila]HOQ65966.1 hypothetical protein [Methanosarcina thermophila]HQD94761.1 hypothetical protein [Methanosarcina thermophila]
MMYLLDLVYKLFGILLSLSLWDKTTAWKKTHLRSSLSKLWLDTRTFLAFAVVNL